MLGNMNSNNDAGLTDFVTDAGFGNVTCEFVVGLKLLDENGEDIFRVSACQLGSNQDWEIRTIPKHHKLIGLKCCKSHLGI